jgi:hypothetical protein
MRNRARINLILSVLVLASKLYHFSEVINKPTLTSENGVAQVEKLSKRVVDVYESKVEFSQRMYHQIEDNRRLCQRFFELCSFDSHPLEGLFVEIGHCHIRGWSRAAEFF